MGIHKNRKVNTFLVSIIMITLLLGGSSQIQAAQEGNFTYSITYSKAEITGYTGPGGAVVIPSTLGGFPVTSISNTAFNYSGLTSITIPQGVPSIGAGAFSGCKGLTSITIPESVTSIGSSAFNNCTNLTSITIPQGVNSLGSEAFSDCTDLNSITFNSATTAIYDRATTISDTAKIIGYDPSTAKDYATKYNRRFEAIGHTSPTASNVTISDNAQVGQTLKGSYQYSDLENDAEGVSAFKWYRSSKADGTQLEAITGAEGKSYKLGTADQDKYIYFEVTPVASTGTLQGTAVLSAASNKVEAINVTGVAALENKSVANKTKLADLNLPAIISIDLSDGSNPTVPVSWDSGTPAYNGNQAGTYTFTGILGMPEGVSNPDNIKATVNVVVSAPVTLQSIAITRPAAKLNYVTGDTLDITGLVVSGTYSEGSTKVESITASNVTGFNSTAAVAKDTDFSDVSSSFWGYNAIKNLSSKGIVCGYPDGTFKPDATITRAEFATMLVKALGLNTSGTTGTFMDVPADAWYYGAVNAAFSAKLVSGMGENLFIPNYQITREQMAVMVAHALGNKAPSIDGTELNAFRDKSVVSSWAVSGMRIAVKSGIVSGMSGNTIFPGNDATRAQAAVMIYRMLSVLGK